jgi:hypothetical protein
MALNSIRAIIRPVREETSAYEAAYEATLDGIQSGANTPDAVDECLRRRFKLPTEEAISKTFLTAQRTGVISRLVDFGLISRENAGLRVTHLVTKRGEEFRSEPS